MQMIKPNVPTNCGTPARGSLVSGFIAAWEEVMMLDCTTCVGASLQGLALGGQGRRRFVLGLVEEGLDDPQL